MVRFAVHEPGKGFQIHKQFDIHQGHQLPAGYEPQRSGLVRLSNGQEMVFTRQDPGNVNDCGPCLALNLLSILGVQNGPTTIGQVRNEVNSARDAAGITRLHNDENLFTSDVRGILERNRVSCDEIVVRGQVQREYLGRARERFSGWHKDYAIFTGSGRHFVGVYVTRDGQMFYLNSFANGPQEIDESRVQQLIETATERSRIESIVFAWKES